MKTVIKTASFLLVLIEKWKTSTIVTIGINMYTSICLNSRVTLRILLLVGSLDELLQYNTYGVNLPQPHWICIEITRGIPFQKLSSVNQHFLNTTARLFITGRCKRKVYHILCSRLNQCLWLSILSHKFLYYRYWIKNGYVDANWLYIRVFDINNFQSDLKKKPNQFGIIENKGKHFYIF